MNYIFVLFFTSLYVSCASTPKRDYRFIEIPNTINTNLEKLLSKEEIKYDTSQTIYALNTAYSGKNFLPPGEFNKLLEDINSIETPMTAAKLCEAIESAMSKVSDNHLSANFKGISCFKNPNLRIGTVGNNTHSKQNKTPWSVQLSKRNKKQALLISITGFPISSDPVWKGFIESVQNELPKSNLVIIDLRGNGGGDDSKGYELASLLAGANLKTPHAKQWTTPTPEAQQIFINTFEYWIRASNNKGSEPPPYLSFILETHNNIPF